LCVVIGSLITSRAHFGSPNPSSSHAVIENLYKVLALDLFPQIVRLQEEMKGRSELYEGKDLE
jgi:hypothetical protein